MLDCEVHGFWDSGPRAIFDYHIDGPPRQDARGRYIKVGSLIVNTWFHVALGHTVKATLANARRQLIAWAKRDGDGVSV